MRAQSTDEQDVKMRPGEEAAREGRGYAGLVQGRDEKHQMNETSGNGKAKGSVGKVEHEGKGGCAGKGEQQSTRNTEDEDEEEDELRE